MSKRGPHRGKRHDPEEVATELWSPVARNLFADEFAAQQQGASPEGEDAATVPDVAPAGCDNLGDTDPGPPPENMPPAPEPPLSDDDEGDTLQVYPRKKKRAKRPKRRKRERSKSQESVGTPPVVAVAGEISDRAGATLARPNPAGPGAEPEEPSTDPESLRDTIDEPPPAQMIDEARPPQSDPGATVKVSGPEARASRVVSPATIPAPAVDPGATMLVEGGLERARASHECRICGRKVNELEPRRWRGSTSSRASFRCDRCENISCAAHAVRASGVIETLLRGGRFRCVLCQDS